MLKTPSQNQDTNQEVHKTNKLCLFWFRFRPNQRMTVSYRPDSAATHFWTCDPSLALVCMQPVVSQQSAIK